MRRKFFRTFVLFFLFISPVLKSASVAPAKGVLFPSPELSRLDLNKNVLAWNSGFQAVYETLLSNLHLPNYYFKTRYAWPSPQFTGVYLWDSAFIAQVWKPWDYKTAEDVLRAVLDSAAPDGRIKHYASPTGKTEYTQPPVIAWSVWEIFKWSGDREFLEYAYPILKNYNNWLYRNRHLANGLFFWAHSYESGIDNSPRFGSVDEKIKIDTSTLAAIDLCSYVYQQNILLAEMAKVLGKPEEAHTFEKNAEELKRLINEKLWDEDTGYYYDLDLKTNQLVKLRTIASFIPLFAGVADSAKAERARVHLMNPQEFNTYFPLPSVARDEPNFVKDCWAGPVWINTAYMAIIGLENYGYKQDSAELAYKLVDGLYRNYELTGKIVEFYDPDQDGFKELHRKHGNLYKLITVGDKPQGRFVGWSGLVNTLLIENLVGFHKETGKKWLAPNFPPSAKGLSLQLSLPAENLTIEIEVLQNATTRGKIIGPDFTKNFSLNPGEKLEL